MIFFVFSGTLKGVRVDDAEDAWDAVEKAVRKQVSENKHCVLGPLTRVCYGSRSGSDGVSLMSPPYEDEFPELFADEELAFEVASVQS